MCRIEYFYVVFPDGSRERKYRSVHCSRGTRHSLCTRIEEFDTFEERPATEDEIRERQNPQYHLISPREEGEPRRGRGRRRSDTDPRQGLAVDFKAHKDRPHEPSPIRRTSRPRLPSRSPSRLPARSPNRRPTPNPRIIPVEPKTSGQGEKKPLKERRVKLKPVQVHNPGKETSSSSPSPPKMTGREHVRDTPVKPKPTSEYEAEKERQRQKEQKDFERARERHESETNKASRGKDEQHQYKERAANEARDARDRAKKLERKLEEYEEVQRYESEQEPKRRGNRTASYHARSDKKETDEQKRARLEQKEKDARAFIEADRLRAQERDRERRQRQRSAGIPRNPRHSNVVHNSGDDDDDDDDDDYDPNDLEERGNAFIKSAIRTEQQRNAERRQPRRQWGQEYTDEDGVRRRDTTDGSQSEEWNGRARPRKRGKKGGGRESR